MVSIYDTKARPRIQMTVDASDAARMELLDEDGQVTHRLPKAIEKAQALFLMQTPEHVALS